MDVDARRGVPFNDHRAPATARRAPRGGRSKSIYEVTTVVVRLSGPGCWWRFDRRSVRRSAGFSDGLVPLANSARTDHCLLCLDAPIASCRMTHVRREGWPPSRLTFPHASRRSPSAARRPRGRRRRRVVVNRFRNCRSRRSRTIRVPTSQRSSILPRAVHSQDRHGRPVALAPGNLINLRITTQILKGSSARSSSHSSSILPTSA